MHTSKIERNGGVERNTVQLDLRSIRVLLLSQDSRCCHAEA